MKENILKDTSKDQVFLLAKYRVGNMMGNGKEEK